MTKDCGVDGCARAEHRLGLCREHERLVPLDMSLRLAAECAKQSHFLKRDYTTRAIELANAAIRGEAVEATSGMGA
jgi:hypothetical protein